MPSIKELLAGDGEWDVGFDIPIGQQKSGFDVATLQVNTNLKGVEARLPPPFNKLRDDAVDFNLRVNFRPKYAPVLQIGYANFVDGIFELGEEGVAGILRGEVRLSGGTVSLPEGPGVRVVGWLDSVSLDEWGNLLPGLTSPSLENDTRASFLHSTDLAVRKLEAFGQQFHNVHLKLAPSENSWHAEVSSEEAAGEVWIPYNLKMSPLVVALKYCYISEPEITTDSVDPRDLPALDMQIDDFRYKDRQFGSLKLETTKVVNGVRIEQIVIKPRATAITGRGGWYIGGGKQNSTIQMNVVSEDVGKTLKTLGYVGGIEGGDGTANLDLQWPSSFPDIDVSQIQGNFDILLNNGQLLDVDPGAGRVFGLLSLQTLPRRLFLDFSDVFKKGFGFDRIKGKFTIEDGDAYTNNLYMDGVAARVEVAGRVGLARQDYDQLVTVTPHIAESLPLLGALTATPQIGAAILFVQKLFQPKIDEATTNQYTISGNWSNPVINKFKPSKAERESNVKQE